MLKAVINGKTEYVKKGTLLSEILIKDNYRIEHLCGGKGLCQKCTVTVNGKKELSCRYRIMSDVSVEFSADNTVFSQTGAEVSGLITQNVCFALDIGSTTLALALVSLDDNKIIKVITRNNPQRAFGADVISRIEYCSKNGVDLLQKTLINEINSMISEFNLNNKVKLYVSGNTTMLHTLFGVDCSSIGVAPYTPAFLEGKSVSADELNISGVDFVESLPCISSFVGADIVAGLNYIGLPENGKYSILVDLGTNAEIVLFNKDSFICTSAAAGPCFEGANISCGMSACEGAVFSYHVNGYKTIGDVAAKGICGTGLIDIIAFLLSEGIVDETGYMESEEYKITDSVSINQADIRQYQLAKSAVFSALKTLIDIKKITLNDIDSVYVSGGFSAKINFYNAFYTGLFPREFKGKCFSLNNSSLLGTVKFACENNNLNYIFRKSDYIDLSMNSKFSDLFINNMLFNTDYVIEGD